MMMLTNIAIWAVRLTGPTQVVLGLLFWTGRALTLLPLHMLIGMVFVLAILVLAGVAARAGLRRALVLLTVALGLVIPLFGITQSRVLPGPAHWVVKLAHLLIGIAAMFVATRLDRFIRSHPLRARVLAAERTTLA
jgi:hypothetical protein